ncbi:MAG: XRE family transcriptional regulator [Candidatus Tagabacteria bacterium CG09_land_8_20_14_0_10_41_14]|uniref:XRE family transcriptional regulator n=1 Tax=Candidatus Tagabacteria bacterium CG09_land_8_20_14_0_10_41_14 TaxID=1975021 RepID=A0A2H0WLR9_9BACT|nr:MAG: XRE family transcriptional regulator [Candidatus Tagabacteria bacterium CG09_land_8_20_14_0_10_41_14]
MVEKANNLGKILRQQRTLIPLTLRELERASGVSSSHLGRIERGERFPSAHILRKIAKPLRLEEEELFRLADYLSPIKTAEKKEEGTPGHLDPIVAGLLGQESVEVQRTVIGILSVLKSIAKAIT